MYKQIIYALVFVLFLMPSCKKKECNTEDFIGTISGNWQNNDSFACPSNLLGDFAIVEDTISDFRVLFLDTDEENLIYEVDLTGPNDEGCTIAISNYPDHIITGVLSNGNLQMSYQNSEGDVTCTYNGTIKN